MVVMLERLNKVMNCKGKSLCSFFVNLLLLGLNWALVSKSVVISDGQPLTLCLVLALMLAFAIEDKKWWSSITCCILIICIYIFPSIAFLWLTIGVAFSILPRTRILSIAPLSLAIIEIVGIVFTDRISLFVYFIVITTLAYIGRSCIRIILMGGSLCFIGATIVSMSLTNTIVIEKPITPNIYTSGYVTAKVTQSKVVESNENIPILRSPSFGSKIESTRHGIVVFDVEQDKPHPMLTGEKWQQPTSWHDQLFLGHSYLLEAIAADGALYSNKGMQLKDTCTSLLALPQSFTISQPLILKEKDIVYLHDSDYSSDYLANYQRHLLSELLFSSHLPYWKRGIQLSCALMILALLLIHPRKWRYTLYLISTIILGLSLYKSYLAKRQGEIRLVGEIRNSHENSRFDGVTKTLIHAGYNYTIGNTNAKILIIKGGETGRLTTEQIAIGEPGAIIKTANHTLKADEMPLHINEDIVDARAWIIDGQMTNRTIIKIDGCTMIATGSPAKLDWKKIIDKKSY